jgi:hypothetical protein
MVKAEIRLCVYDGSLPTSPTPKPTVSLCAVSWLGKVFHPVHVSGRIWIRLLVVSSFDTSAR